MATASAKRSMRVARTTGVCRINLVHESSLPWPAIRRKRDSGLIQKGPNSIGSWKTVSVPSTWFYLYFPNLSRAFLQSNEEHLYYGGRIRHISKRLSALGYACYTLRVSRIGLTSPVQEPRERSWERGWVWRKGHFEVAQGGGWIGVCKSADPLKLMAESVDPLKKSTKSDSANTNPSRICALLFLVIFSTAWHRHIRKRNWAFQGDIEIHDPNFLTTKIQNPGP